jgi:hypothetical protein
MNKTEETLLHLATAMVCAQSMERSLVQVLRLAVPGKKTLSAEQAQEFVSNLNRRTLGQLFDMLKQRAEIEKSVLEALERVVENRNKLSHGLLKLSTEIHASILASFPISAEVMKDSESLSKVFNAILMKQAGEHGITTHVDDIIRRHIGEAILSNASNLIKPKHSHN